MKINRKRKDQTVKFGELQPGDVFQPVWGAVETYYMVISKLHLYPETAVELETGTLKMLYPEDDVIPFDAELTLEEKQ